MFGKKKYYGPLLLRKRKHISALNVIFEMFITVFGGITEISGNKRLTNSPSNDEPNAVT